MTTPTETRVVGRHGIVYRGSSPVRIIAGLRVSNHDPPTTIGYINSATTFTVCRECWKNRDEPLNTDALGAVMAPIVEITDDEVTEGDRLRCDRCGALLWDTPEATSPKSWPEHWAERRRLRHAKPDDRQPFDVGSPGTEDEHYHYPQSRG
ncbi:MAG: hypothetical protein OXG35_33870 [Acidobacteria bacterium]|nr:hypothetical protein [Acidobacteriota bacterium]